MNILLSAYAVSPNLGSEPAVGWNWAIQLAKYCNVFIITEKEFKDQIELAIKDLPQKNNLLFFYNDIGDKARKMCWNQGDYRFYYFYRKWQKKSLSIAREIMSEHEINIIHHLNMIGYREPGFLWKIKDVPYVWGPIGGFIFVKRSFLPSLGFKNGLFYLVKNALNLFQIYTNVRVKKAINRADLLLSASGETQIALKRYFNKDSILLNETGCHINMQNINEYSKVINNESFNVLWVGRFIPTKLLLLTLKTIKEVKNLKGITFHMVGGGNLNESIIYWKKVASKIGVDNYCRWYGKIPHTEVQKLMRSCDLLFFPSIVEGTSHVVLEAISNSLPIICFDTCGHGEIVSNDIGRKVKMSSPQENIKDFANEISTLYYDRALLNQLSFNCKSKILELSWNEKAKKMVDYYSTIVMH